MKIAIVVSSLRKAGPIIVVQNLVRNFNRKDHDIVIIKLMKDEAARSITNEFVEDGIKVYEFNTSRLKTELLTAIERRRFNELIQTINPDIIHTHGYQAVRLAAGVKDIPVLETIHNVPEEDFIKRYGKILGTYMLRRYYSSMKKLAAAVAISENVKNNNVPRLPELKVERIYNGVKVPESKYQSRDEARAQYGVKEDTTLFVSIGALLPMKDQLTIIRAFRKAFPRENRKVELWFLGKGPLWDECIREIGDDDRIKMLGWQYNVYDYLMAADYSISASHSEGFGLNYMESIFAGVPMIASDIPVFREFTGYFPELKQFEFRVGDSDELADRLVKATRTKIDMDEYIGIARKTFSASTMAAEYERFYKSLIGNRQ
ncbi:MAG: glycosyltransferase [Bacteroides sp.]|nr:glycosyltransferase [Bacteroides sp.]